MNGVVCMPLLRKQYIVYFFILLFCCLAPADTITMKNGVHVDGKVLREVGGVVHVQIGERQVRLHKKEIIKIEGNEKDGSLDLKAAQLAAEEEDRKLTQEMGLDIHQREKVMRHVILMTDADAMTASEAKRALKAMAAEVNILPFIKFMLPSYLPATTIVVLDVIADLYPTAALDLIKEYAVHPEENVRAKAVSLLGRVKDRNSLETILRGLIDESSLVVAGAMSAVASLSVKQATPLLFRYYTHGNPYLQSSARETLKQIWEDTGSANYSSLKEWETFWEANKGTVEKTVDMESLTPLVPPGTRYPGC